MKRMSFLLGGGLVALVCGSQAFALGHADAPISATVVERAGIDIVSPLVLPTVSATTVATAASTGVAGGTGAPASTGALGNATLTIHGQAGDAVSMAVPETFRVIRDGGTEALTVQTNTNSDFGLGNAGAGGTVMNGDTMSVNVGGNINLASADGLVPGPYQGLLVVVVQYN